MRIPETTNYNTVRDSINRSREKMNRLQIEGATQKKLNAPSNDPSGAAKVLEVRTDKVNNEQFQMNAKLAETFLSNSDHVLSELADIVVRAKEIAVGQASGASSTDETRLGVSEEVSQLFQQSIALANRRIGDRYLFGGYRIDRQPVETDGRYSGDEGQMMVEIARDMFISMNIPGIEIFNTHPQNSADAKGLFQRANPGAEQPEQDTEIDEVNRGPASLETDLNQNVNLFSELGNLRIALLTGDLEGVRNTLDSFDQLHSKLVSIRAKIGSRINGIQNTYEALDRHNITNMQLTTGIEDADMVQVMNDLAKEETVFRSALQSSKRLIQPTLMDFLK